MNQTWPKISVFILTYNSKLFIKECIESVLIQEYPNLEIVIGDDGSTDGTPDILKEYNKNYPGLFKLVLSETNTGITANCNRVLAQCNGEYIAFLAGDDLWCSGKLQKQIAWFNANPNKILNFTLTEVFDDRSSQKMAIAPTFQKQQFLAASPIIQAYILGQVESSFLLKRKYVPSYGFEASIPNVSDLIFFVEIFQQGEIGYIDEVLTKYRKHSESTSKKEEKICVEHYLSYLILEKKYPELNKDIVDIKRNIIFTLMTMNSESSKKLENQIIDTFKIKELFLILIKRIIKKIK